MKKREYDTLIEEEYICRIAFKGESHPYIAPFLYIFDGEFMCFLSTKCGRKVKYFKKSRGSISKRPVIHETVCIDSD